MYHYLSFYVIIVCILKCPSEVLSQAHEEKMSHIREIISVLLHFVRKIGNGAFWPEIKLN